MGSGSLCDKLYVRSGISAGREPHMDEIALPKLFQACRKLLYKVSGSRLWYAPVCPDVVCHVAPAAKFHDQEKTSFCLQQRGHSADFVYSLGAKKYPGDCKSAVQNPSAT